MSDLTRLHLLLGVFYLLECVRFVPPDTVLWHAGRRWKSVRPNGSFLLAGRAVLWLAWWLPHRPMLFTRPLPVTADSDVLVLAPCQWPVRLPRPVAASPVIAWTDVQGIWAEGGVMRAKAGGVVHAVATPDAEWLAAWCRQVWKAAPDARDPAIDRGLADRFNQASADTSLGQWSAAANELGSLGVAFLSALLIWIWSAQASQASSGIDLSLPWLALAVASWAFNVVRYWQLHEKLHPDDHSTRLKRSLTMVLMPVSAVFTARHFAAPGSVDPLLPAVLNGDSPESLADVQDALRDLRYPLPDPQAASTMALFRDRMLNAIEQCLKRPGHPAVARPQPSGPNDSLAVFTCPRCREAYERRVPRCSTCGLDALSLRPAAGS